MTVMPTMPFTQCTEPGRALQFSRLPDGTVKVRPVRLIEDGPDPAARVPGELPNCLPSDLMREAKAYVGSLGQVWRLGEIIIDADGHDRLARPL